MFSWTHILIALQCEPCYPCLKLLRTVTEPYPTRHNFFSLSLPFRFSFLCKRGGVSDASLHHLSLLKNVVLDYIFSFFPWFMTHDALRQKSELVSHVFLLFSLFFFHIYTLIFCWEPPFLFLFLEKISTIFHTFTLLFSLPDRLTVIYFKMRGSCFFFFLFCSSSFDQSLANKKPSSNYTYDKNDYFFRFFLCLHLLFSFNKTM